MYSDQKKKSHPGLWLLLILCAVAAGIMGFRAGQTSGRDMQQEAVQSVKEAVERAALQCYVVEGAYPPDLEYLTEKYGLSVNTRDYYIRYDAFASNLPPDVRGEPKANTDTIQ